MFVVLDTNILVSALLSPLGKPAQILNRYTNGEFTLCVDERILAEYEKVLTRPKFNFQPIKIHSLLRYIREHSISVTASEINVPFVDVSDKKFYEVAKHCHAILLTGNLKHFPKDEQIKSVHDFS